LPSIGFSECAVIDDPKINLPGTAPIERLPTEILQKVLGYLAVEIPPTEYTPRNVDIVSCLLTSRTISAAALNVLYNHITVPHSKIFSKFMNQLRRFPELGLLVRRLDLSHFTSVGMGRTQRDNAEIQNLTNKTLFECLQLIPAVQEVLFQQNIDTDIDIMVLKQLFTSLPNLRALDLCASSTQSFTRAFTGAMDNLRAVPSLMLNIRRLGLHECSTLPGEDINVLLSRMPHLTHLDLHHTRVTATGLQSIPQTARLTHLNLGRCTALSGVDVVNFLENHPAAKTLVYLNLASDPSRSRLLRPQDTDRLLEILPRTLRSLSLNGAKISPTQLTRLIPFTKHLEELAIAHAEVSMRDVLQFFVPASSLSNSVTSDAMDEDWVPSTLHYIDLTSVAAVTQPSIFANSPVLLSSLSGPLEVIEVGEKVITDLGKAKVASRKYGWVVKELGRRGWYVREAKPEEKDLARGARDWKMGSNWWGMRKFPVAQSEVGGLYGHYMFKK